MIGIRWLYGQAIRGDAAAWRDGGNARCYLCGAACPAGEPSQPTKQAMRDTFTNHDLARCRSSSWVCPACAWYLDHSGDFLRCGWLLDRVTAVVWQRDRMRLALDDVLGQVPGAFPLPLIFTIPTSFKKHLLLRAQPSAATNAITVQFEEQAVTLTADLWRDMTAPFDALRRLGHSKSEITSGQLHPVALKRHGRIADALTHMNALAPYRGGAAFELVAHVSPAGDVTEKEESHDRHGDTGRNGGALAPAVGEHQLRIQEQVPTRDLGAISKSRRRPRTHDEQSGDLTQPTLFDL